MERQQEVIFNNSVDLTFMIGVEEGRYRFITVNNAFLTAAALTRKQVEGKYVKDVISDSLHPFIFPKYDQAIRERQTVQWENTSDYPGGLRTDVITITPVFNEQDICTILVGTVHNITERKKAEEKLRSREKQLDLIYNTVSDVIFLLAVEAGPRYRFSTVNTAFLDSTGLTREQIEGKYVHEIIPEPSLSLVLSNYQQAIDGHCKIQWEETSDYPAGRKTGIVTITPVYNESGECDMLVGAVHDITERKKVQEEKDKVTYLLNERVKELTTLYRADQLLKSEETPVDMLMQELVAVLPPGWQYPAITEARIVLGDQQYCTKGFHHGISSQSADFRIPDGRTGKIEVVYTRETPAEAEGAFLTEERNLINMLAEMLRVYFSRKGAVGQLLKEKELSDRIIGTLPGLFYMIDENGKYLRWNKLKETLSGYSHEEMARMHSLDFFAAEEKEIVAKAIADGFRNGHTEVEAHVLTKEGRRVLHYFTGVVIDYEGKTCLMGMGMDITERRRAAEQLLKQKELLESLINSLPGIFYLFDNTGQYLLWNKNHETVPGYSAEEMRTMYPLNFFEGDEKERIQREIEKVFTTGYAEVEAEFLTKDGRKIPHYFNGIAIDYDNKPCLMGVGIDMTERKKIETELREAEIKFRTLVERSQVGVYIVQQGKFTYVNPRFAAIFGYNQEELIGEDPVSKIINEDYQALANENVRARMSGEVETVHYEASGKKKDGTINRIEFYGSRTLYEGQPTIIGTMVDITERKLAEEALQKSEANLHTVFDTTDTIYVLLDMDFRIVSFNQRAADFTKNELHGRMMVNTPIADYFPGERRKDLRQRLKEVVDGDLVNYESSYVQPDGSMNWYYVRMFPVSGNTDNIFGLMIAVSDITEKKLLEQEIMDQKVQEQKKMTRAVLNAQEKERNKIGQELHDNVNQILVGAKMYLGSIRDKNPDNADIIRQSIGLVDNAINEIRSLTREQVTPQRQIDLRDLIQSLVDNMKKHSRIETDFVYDIGSFAVKDDLKINIYRIVQEGINNILKHAAAQKVSIMVKADTMGLHVVIADDGKGFSSSMAGTRGVGITNILNRVESYNGRVFIESQPGPGCKIDITVPI
ncbi:MAG TPA: PAS domain S-box protein [Chitinophagaceae bacterium]|jgi:PAS domain S-box-containing protein|nr:PAS domain S-box protein [Chitinophagaceae bacterium]